MTRKIMNIKESKKLFSTSTKINNMLDKLADYGDVYEFDKLFEKNNIAFFTLDCMESFKKQFLLLEKAIFFSQKLRTPIFWASPLGDSAYLFVGNEQDIIMAAQSILDDYIKKEKIAELKYKEENNKNIIRRIKELQKEIMNLNKTLEKT